MTLQDSGVEPNAGGDSNSESSWASDSDSDKDRIVSPFWGNDDSSSSSDEEDEQSEDKQDKARRSDTTTKSLESIDERNKMSMDPDYAWEKLKASQVFLKPPIKKIPSCSSTHANNVCRFVFISDTHGNHRHIPHLPPGDVLVHSGDFTKSGETGTIKDLSLYFRDLVVNDTFSKVICVAGNHDLTLDQDYYDQNWQRFHKSKKFDPSTAQTSIREHAIYLHDESHRFEFPAGNVQVWGSPYSPRFFNWGFMKERGPPIREIWDKIPNSDSSPKPIDVLITHGPPLGRGDLVYLPFGRGTTRAGCYDLLQTIQQHVQPKVNVFGHIHEGYGVTYDGTTLFVNASTMNKSYEAVHLPIVIDIPIHENNETTTTSTNSCVVVQPSSIFCNQTTKIQSMEEWIEWCRKYGHDCVADTLEEGEKELFDRARECPPDKLFECLTDGMEQAYRRPSREFRRNLATMVFHLYALAFEEDEKERGKTRPKCWCWRIVDTNNSDN